MAPEQTSRRGEPLAHTIDVYHLGGVLLFLLTKHGPFHGFGEEYVKLIGNCTLPDLKEDIQNSTHPLDLSLRKAIDMCWKCRPEDRKDAREVAAFLDNALSEYKGGPINY